MYTNKQMLKFIDNLSFVFNCFCAPKPMKDTHDAIFDKIHNLSVKHKISILPTVNKFCLDNLYPKTNQVHTWSTFVIGKDKTYILAHVNNLDIANAEKVLNKKGDGVLPDIFIEFFDPIWDKTLTGSALQFLMIYDNLTYLVNTYPFHNESSHVIGACMFLRLFDTMPPICSRLSLETGP